MSPCPVPIECDHNNGWQPICFSNLLNTIWQSFFVLLQDCYPTIWLGRSVNKSSSPHFNNHNWKKYQSLHARSELCIWVRIRGFSHECSQTYIYKWCLMLKVHCVILISMQIQSRPLLPFVDLVQRSPQWTCNCYLGLQASCMESLKQQWQVESISCCGMTLLQASVNCRFVY